MSEVPLPRRMIKMSLVRFTVVIQLLLIIMTAIGIASATMDVLPISAIKWYLSALLQVTLLQEILIIVQSVWIPAMSEVPLPRQRIKISLVRSTRATQLLLIIMMVTGIASTMVDRQPISAIRW